jgi:hypothetical protein
MRRVFFVDDNLIGNRPQAKALLAFLADYQKRNAYTFSFGTEASLNLAEDDELLDLLRKANFSWVFIGIETTDEESLKETRKTQNVGTDILAGVRRVYAQGIDVLAGFIIGFDHDTIGTFDRQRDFIMASGIQSAMVGLLHALPRTPLHERMQREGRLRDDVADCDNTQRGTNIVPMQMDYEDMVERYKVLYRELMTDRAIAQRVGNKMRYMRAPLYTGGYGEKDSAGIVWRLLRKGILPGGPARWLAFLRSLWGVRVQQFPTVVCEWIIALSMADFVRRHLGDPVVAPAAAERRMASLHAAIAPYVEAGGAALHVTPAHPASHLSLSMHGLLDHRFFARAARHLDQVLRHTPATLTLHIEQLRETEHHHLQRLLRRLRRYGDRISIVVDEKLRNTVTVDSSVFHLILVERAV